MRSVSQINTILGGSYLSKDSSRCAGTTTLLMLNLVLPKLYDAGMWRALVTEIQMDCAAGYAVLAPDYEAVLAALVNDCPTPVQGMSYEYSPTGPLIVEQPASSLYGIIDEGLVPLMSDVPEDGIDELIFASTSAFASGDTATVTYTDSDEDVGYAQVVLPLHTITVASSTSPAAISVAANGGTDATTGEVLTTLTTADNSAMGLVAGLGLTLSQLTGTDATYIGTFRIHSIPSSTTVKIVKAYVALTGTLAAVTTPRLMPVSTIASVESIVYAGLPARTTVKDADDTLYAILNPGEGCAEFRRYQVPQPEVDTTSDWTLQAWVKRKFIPLTGNSDLVYLDNINVLKHAFLATIAEDNSDLERASVHWAEVEKMLQKELSQYRGGAKHYPSFEPWGRAIAPVPSLY